MLVYKKFFMAEPYHSSRKKQIDVADLSIRNLF